MRTFLMKSANDWVAGSRDSSIARRVLTQELRGECGRGGYSRAKGMTSRRKGVWRHRVWHHAGRRNPSI